MPAEWRSCLIESTHLLLVRPVGLCPAMRLSIEVVSISYWEEGLHGGCQSQRKQCCHWRDQCCCGLEHLKDLQNKFCSLDIFLSSSSNVLRFSYKGPFKCYLTHWGWGGVIFHRKKCYECVRLNVISVTRGCVGVDFPEDKHYETLE